MSVLLVLSQLRAERKRETPALASRRRVICTFPDTLTNRSLEWVTVRCSLHTFEVAALQTNISPTPDSTSTQRQMAQSRATSNRHCSHAQEPAAITIAL